MNVMITGAAGGLGRALAVECASRGYRLFLTDIGEQGLTAIKRGLERQFGATVAAQVCDLTDEGSVARMVDLIDRANIRFDMLLNVAGIDHEGGFLERECQKALSIVSLNIEATLRVTHKALNRRRPNAPFYLVFVSSLASMYPMPLKATYAASKRFLLDFSIALGDELKSRGVHVLSLCPAGLATTRQAMTGIAAQGFWGDVTTNRLERVARDTIQAALQGRRVLIPGIFNRFLALLGRMIPARAISAILLKRWSAALRKRPDDDCG